MSSTQKIPRPEDLAEIGFDSKGLVAAIIQDDDTGDVLMLGWMNREALSRTLETGLLWFWSRSRQELWKKGATSGNTQHVREIRYDCDGDALVVKVHPDGPICHTGARRCFFRSLTHAADPD